MVAVALWSVAAGVAVDMAGVGATLGAFLENLPYHSGTLKQFMSFKFLYQTWKTF